MEKELIIRTGRLELIAETAELAAAEIDSPRALAGALDAEVPEGEWPPAYAADALPLFAAMLRRDPGLAGWLSWYWVLIGPDTSPRALIGCGGFTSRPVSGVVAIGYSLLPGYRGRGYATEAVKALVQWAFSHTEVREVVAETLPDNGPSIRVLERCGFMRAGPGSEEGHIRFVLHQ